MERLCRLCLNTSENSSELTVFSNHYNEWELYNLIVVNEDVLENSSKSQICQTCLTQMCSFSELRYRAVKNNDLYLQKKLVERNYQVKEESIDPLFHLLQIKLEDDPELNSKDVKRSLKHTRQPKNITIKNESEESLEFNYKDHGKLLPEEDGMSIFKRKITCNHCNKRLLYIGFTRHCEKKHLNQRTFPCTQCEKSFNCEKDLKKHLQKHLGYLSYSCPIKSCDSVFFSKKELNQHSSQYHPKKNNAVVIGRIICSLCGKSYRTDSIKAHHERIHLKKRDYECDICGRHFFKKEHVLVHLRRHLKIEPYTCDICSKTYVSNETMIQHKKTHLPEENRKIFKCSYPGCSVTSFQSLSQHVKIFHLKLRPHSCPHPGCERSFDTASSLRKHIPKHLTEANFACECGQKFKSELFLRNHKRFKHELPRYPCPVENCGQRFHMPSTLEIHNLKVHQGIKKFVCELCSKAYTKKELLMVHISDIHFKNKVSCFICSSKFARIATLRQHAKKHHANEELDDLMKKISSIKTDYEKMEFIYE